MLDIPPCFPVSLGTLIHILPSSHFSNLRIDVLASKGDLVVSYEEKTLIMWDMKAGAQKATFTADKVRDTDGVCTRRAPYFQYGWGQYAQGTLLAVRMGSVCTAPLLPLRLGSVRTGYLISCTGGVSTHREPCLLDGWGQYAQRPYFHYVWGRYAQGTFFPVRVGSIRKRHLISSTDGVGTHRALYFHCSQTCVKGSLSRF